MFRKLGAEFFGTAVFVFLGCGVATITIGIAAMTNIGGIFADALGFALIASGLWYALNRVSGAHLNPAVTLGALISRRIELADAINYWVAQFLGGLVGGLLLWGTFVTIPAWKLHTIGIGASAYGTHSMVAISALGAFLAETILTAIFVFVWLSVTDKEVSSVVAGSAIGGTFGVIYLFSIALDGGGENPARSFAAAVISNGDYLKQVWVFVLAPLVGAVIGAFLNRFINGEVIEVLELVDEDDIVEVLELD